MKRATGHRIQVTLKWMSLWTVWITLDKLHTRPSEASVEITGPLFRFARLFSMCFVFDLALIFLPEFLLWTEKNCHKSYYQCTLRISLPSFVCMEINLENFSSTIKGRRKKMGTRSFIIRHRFHWTRFSFQQVHLC